MKKTLRALNKKRGELKGALSQVSTEVGDLRDDAKTAGQQVGRQAWLAALGTVASVENLAQRGFAALVAKGKKVTLPRLPESDDVVESLQQAAGRAREIGESVGQKASRLVEKGSEKMLDRFGVPSKNDIQTLLKQVQQLTAKVERMNGGRATTRRARA
jgi:poly(hydroxyalkanoate) granule-associated protein